MRTSSLFCRNERSHLGIMKLNDTRNVSLTSSLFRGFVFVAAITENPQSHR